MPTPLHPQAKFDPIPPDLDLHSLVDSTPNLEWALRISTTQIRNLGAPEFEKLVQLHVVLGGKPLVIQGWNEVLPSWLFSAKWLEQSYDKKRKTMSMTLALFTSNLFYVQRTVSAISQTRLIFQ
jgi:hypothetical protein